MTTDTRPAPPVPDPAARVAAKHGGGLRPPHGHAAAAIVLLLLAPGFAVAVDPDPEGAGAPRSSVLRYRLDPDLLRDEFRSAGTLTIDAPMLGRLSFVGQENELTRHGDRDLGIPYLHVLGSAAAHPGSTANLLVGEHGLYGHARLPAADGRPDLRIRFDVVQTGAGHFEEVVTVTPVVAAPARPAPPGPGLHAHGNHSAALGSAPPAPAFPAAAAVAADGEESEFYGVGDGEMDASYDVDYSDDYAQKRIDLPAGALTGATSAYLWVYASAQFCGAGGTPHALYANNVHQHAYNSCNWFPTGTFNWAAFPISLASLLDGQANSLRIADVGSSWNDRDHYFGLDTDTNAGHTVASANGAPQSGELMWQLEIRGSDPAEPVTETCGQGQQATRHEEIRKNTSTSAATPPDPCANEIDCSGGMAISWVTYHAEHGFAQYAPDWRDRIVKSAAEYAPMWQALCISLRVWPVEASTDILTSTNCNGEGGVIDNYRAWLVGTWFNDPAAWNDDAYQLWTHRNIYWPDSPGPNDAWCFGVAIGDTIDIGRSGFSAGPASVIEGKDFHSPDDVDFYDPDELHESGIVSGHELAHSYGEENHPEDCDTNTWYQTDECNIMRNGQEPADRQFRFTRGSQREILFRFHYASEASTPNDG